MSENQQPQHDLLEEAIGAFRRMTVGERPADVEMLARFGIRPGNGSRPWGIPIPSKGRYRMHLLVSSAAAALLLGGLALYLRQHPQPESVRVAAVDLSGKDRDVADPPPSKGRELLREGLGSFKQRIAEAEVIVVATAVDSAEAPPRKPGDLPEVLLQFQVKRVLKGKLDDQVITTRTPTAADEFLGKDWVILLSPDYITGKHQYASHLNAKLEPTVKSYLEKDKK